MSQTETDESNAVTTDEINDTNPTTTDPVPDTTTIDKEVTADDTTDEKEVAASNEDASKKDASKKDENTKDETTDEKTEVKTEEKTEEVSLPATMKALVLLSHNEDMFKGVKLMEMPVPKPSENQILVKVAAASLNPVDYKIARGWMHAVLPVKFPFILGRDCSGIVVSCGKGVKNIKPGMRVAGMIDRSLKQGTLAEYALLSKPCCVEIPDSLDLVEAASVPLVSQTSYQAVVNKGKLAENDKVLIFGGSTSTGIYAIQLAKIFGASEIVVTSSQEEFCKSLGATKVYNYKNKDHDWFKDLQGKEFDIVYDCVGGKEHWDKSQKILKKKGHFVTIVGDQQHGDKLTYGSLMKAGASIANRKFWGSFGYQSYDLVLTDATHSFPQIMQYFKDNKMKAVLDSDSPFTLDNYDVAFKKSMNHKARGKLVVEIKGGKIEKEQEKEVVVASEDDVKTAEKDENAVTTSEATMKSAANDDATGNDATDADADASDAKETDADAAAMMTEATKDMGATDAASPDEATTQATDE